MTVVQICLTRPFREWNPSIYISIKLQDQFFLSFFPSFFLSLFFLAFRAAHIAYGCSQVRDRIGTTAAGLHHSHSNARSEPHL